jgi:hypothetical protein
MRHDEWMTRSRAPTRSAPVAGLAIGALCAMIAGCGLDVSSPDLFVLHRTGQGKPLTLLVNDGGTIRCDGAKSKSLPDPLLLDARDLASDLDQDVKDKVRFARPAHNSVFSYKVTLQDGTVSFSDTSSARGHPELARAELFTAQAAQGPCGLSG